MSALRTVWDVAQAALEVQLPDQALAEAFTVVLSLGRLTDADRARMMDVVLRRYCRYCWIQLEDGQRCHCTNDE